MVCNTAIFYDIENLLGLFGGKINTILHLEEIYRRVLEMDGVHGVSVQKAYADWGVLQHKNLRSSVLQVGIEPVHIFNTNLNDKVKNAADVCLIIDVVDLLSRAPEIENYVIASGDGIFAFLAKKLHERGKRVIGCSFEKITNIVFRNACDYFIALEKADPALIGTSKKQKPNAPTFTVAVENVEPPPPPPPPPKKPKPANNLPRTKYSEALEEAGIAIMKGVQEPTKCFHQVRRMVEVLFAKEENHLPGLEISVFATYLSHYLPNFKVTRHGFKRIGEFMRFILSGSPYCIHHITDNVLLIAPREKATGTIMEDVNGLLITTESGSKYNSVFNLPRNEPFAYKILPEEKPAPSPLPRKKPGPKPKEKPPEPQPANGSAPQPQAPQESNMPEDSGSIRRWIKERFEKLSEADKLVPGEVRKLLTAEYSLATFGVRAPIFREIETRSNLTEQRTHNGKVKYWKESFRFNNKTYLVYKEWASLHRERFAAWYDAVK